MSSFERMSKAHKQRLDRFLNVKSPTHANVCWYISGKRHEVLHANIPKNIAYGKAAMLRKNTAYSPGKIIVELIRS